MPNFRTCSVFLVPNIYQCLMVNGNLMSLYFYMLYVCIYFVLDWFPWFGARLWVTVDFFFLAGTIDFLFFLLVCWFVNCQSNLQSSVRTENGSVHMILTKVSRYCHKKCMLVFSIFNTPVNIKLKFIFFARFYMYIYSVCSSDFSIYHWKLVIHQSIK